MYTTLLVVSYLSILTSTEAKANFNSPKIRNQSQLEVKLAEEREKLKGQIEDNVTINAVMIPGETPHATKISEKEYGIVLDTSESEWTLRHELYHVAKGHPYSATTKTPKIIRALKYLFWDEPQAAIYASTGLKP